MSYLPTADLMYQAFVVNFAALLTADPAAYGEDAASALIVQTAVDDFVAAMTLATDPTTRTSPTIADKDYKRALCTARMRPVAMRINALASVTDLQREALGLTVRKTDKTPVPPPATAPSLAVIAITPGINKLAIADETTPTSKAKPAGVTGCEIFRAVGAVPAVDPAAASYFARTTKTPVSLSTAGTTPGQTVTYFARWTTRSGPSGVAQHGPWSLPLAIVSL